MIISVGIKCYLVIDIKFYVDVGIGFKVSLFSFVCGKGVGLV